MRREATIRHCRHRERFSRWCRTAYHVKKEGCAFGIRGRDLLARYVPKHRGPPAHRSLAIEVRGRIIALSRNKMRGMRVP